LRQFAAVIAPDFSTYVGMPRAMQIWNVWRTNFVAWWWQNAGLKVIANSQWSDKQSYDYSFNVLPQGGCIAVSIKGCVADDNRAQKQESFVEVKSRFKQGFEAMVQIAQPSQILWFGYEPKWLIKFAKQNPEIQILHIKQRKLYQERLDRKKGEH
jgi:predicted transcriptional regulator